LFWGEFLQCGDNFFWGVSSVIAYLINIGAKKNGKISRTGVFFFGVGVSVNLKEFGKICYTFHTKKHFANFRTQVTKTFGKFWI
jgi:hypothetical protein